MGHNVGEADELVGKIKDLIDLRSKKLEVYDNTETQLNMLLQILVFESLEKLRDIRSKKRSKKRMKLRTTDDMYEAYRQFAVTSFELEGQVNRKTFSRNKDSLIKNCFIEDWHFPGKSNKRPWTYYNTTPLGKVLAMKYWYKKNEPREIKIKRSGLMKILEFEPAELLGSFFEYLPKLKKYSNFLKEKPIIASAIELAFSVIDINPGLPALKPLFSKKGRLVGVEINFSLKLATEYRIIKYFRLDGPANNIPEMYEYILDSLTFIFLMGLKSLQKSFYKNRFPLVSEILNDPDLRSFYQQYKMERQQDLQESLNFLSDDN